MNPPNKRAINAENLPSTKKPVKRENLRQRENKKESKSSESYEQTNITESSMNQKRKKGRFQEEKAGKENGLRIISAFPKEPSRKCWTIRG